jgi:outer membrane protein assembly factor BamB
MMMRTSLFLPFALVLALTSGCKKNEPPTVSPPDTPPADTNWVTHPQVDIPWPGLADSPWPMFLHDPQHTGRSPYRGPQEGKVEWLFNAGSPVYSSPAIDQDGSIYFGCENRYFYAVNPEGSQKWSILGGGSDSSPLVSNDGSIYCYGRGASQIYSYVYSYDRTGNLNWQYTVDELEPLSAPVISKDGNTIYVAAQHLFAIASDGTLRWKLAPDSTDQCHYSIAVSPDGATLYVPGYKALYAVDTSGILKWKFSRPTSNPAVDNDGNIYFSSGGFFSLTSSGVVRWENDDIIAGGEDVGPVIGRDGAIYILGRALYALDYVGKLKWEIDMSIVSQCVPAIDIDGTLYFGRITDQSNPADSINFMAVNPNGTLRFQISLKSPDGTLPDIDSRPAISSDGKIYVGSDYPHGFNLYKVK